MILTWNCCRILTIQFLSMDILLSWNDGIAHITRKDLKTSNQFDVFMLQTKFRSHSGKCYHSVYKLETRISLFSNEVVSLLLFDDVLICWDSLFYIRRLLYQDFLFIQIVGSVLILRACVDSFTSILFHCILIFKLLWISCLIIVRTIS